MKAGLNDNVVISPYNNKITTATTGHGVSNSIDHHHNNNE